MGRDTLVLIFSDKYIILKGSGETDFLFNDAQKWKSFLMCFKVLNVFEMLEIGPLTSLKNCLILISNHM